MDLHKFSKIGPFKRKSPPKIHLEDETERHITIVLDDRAEEQVNTSLDVDLPQIAMGNETVRNYAHFWEIKKFKQRSNSSKPFKIKSKQGHVRQNDATHMNSTMTDGTVITKTEKSKNLSGHKTS